MPVPAPDATPDAEVEPASAVLGRLAKGDGTSISFAEILAHAGPRVHGLALLLLVLPETVPLPLPSASTVLAIPLGLIALHLAVYGEGGRWPRRLERFRVSRAATSAVARYLVPVLAWFESFSRPRLTMLAHRERLVGLVSFYLSLVLLLPLPLMNTPPAICLALLALGLIQQDGVLIAAGLVGTVAVTIALAAIVILARGLLGF